MEFVTIAQVKRANEYDTAGELVNAEAFMRLSAQHVRLYDPPVDGVTPVDGEGKPMTSDIGARDSLKALAKGFTEEPVGKKGK